MPLDRRGLAAALFLLSQHPAQADEPIQLPPIVEVGEGVGLPSDALERDPVLPAQSGPIEIGSGTGVVHGLENKLPFSVSDTGRAGQLSQLKGNGLSAEDIDAETLGVPLNSSAGGGFDLSAFPEFIWSDYRFQLGPSLTGYDIRAVSGTLNLVPWTARALEDKSSGGRGTALVSSNDLYQLSTGYHQAGEAAALAGYSFGSSSGPALGFSADLYRSKTMDSRFHLLFTRQDAETPGPALSPSPQAHQITERVIPVAQADFRLPQDVLLKTSVFYDGQRLRYQDPSVSLATSDRTQQAGAEAALLSGEWKAGLSSRYVVFHQLAFNAPDEDVTALQLARSMDLGAGLLLDPNLQAVWITRMGAYPQGSVGLRKDFSQDPGSPQALFARASYSNKFPTLVDRYYIDPYSQPNPTASPESDYTAIAGGELGKRGTGRVSLQQMVQLRESTLLVTSLPNYAYEKVNAGESQVLSTILEGQYDALPWLSIGESASHNYSLIEQTHTRFPSLSDWISVGYVEATAHGWKDARFRASLRAASSFVADLQGDQVGGYGLIDLQTGVEILKGVQATGKIENLTGQPAQLTWGYPLPGRIFSLLISGNF